MPSDDDKKVYIKRINDLQKIVNMKHIPENRKEKMRKEIKEIKKKIK